MSPEPTVSIIIPTYNRARLLPNAIRSVLEQSYGHIEIVVIDDGSTDDTRKVLEPFAEKIRYLTSDHKGTAHARNVGMRAATGKYIAFLDSDDVYLPYKIELQVAFMEDHPEVDMVYTEFSGSYENSFVDEYHLRTYHDSYERKGWAYDDMFPVKGEFFVPVVKRSVEYYIGNIFKYNLLGTAVPSNTVLFRKEILSTVGYQNETYRLAQDYEFVARICKHCQVAFLNIPTYVLLHHKDNASNVHERNKARQRENILRQIKAIEVFLNVVMDWGYNDEEYYGQNKEMVDARLAEVYFILTIWWLEYGDEKKSAECLQKCRYFDQNNNQYKKYLWIASIPFFLRKGLIVSFYIYREWSFLLFNKSQRRRIFRKWKSKFTTGCIKS
jgi:glycosyltransferase involved in cell wall biosynthesis